MKDLTFRTCAKCGRHQGGRLHHFEGRVYCARCWREKLEWDEQRGIVIAAIQTGAMGVSVTKDPAPRIKRRERMLYLARHEADRASFALKYNLLPAFVRACITVMWILETLEGVD